MSPLARKIPLAIVVHRELDAAFDEIVDARRSVLADLVDDLRIAEPCAGYHRIARMLVESIVLAHHAADSTLREIRVAVLELGLRHERDAAVGRKMQRAHQSGHSRTNHEIIAINYFHDLYYIRSAIRRMDWPSPLRSAQVSRRCAEAATRLFASARYRRNSETTLSAVKSSCRSSGIG